ncbi:MAG: RDD family protein [Flavobacteriales bacterium]|nr:RDD family protein [Flavobacteriales bacterium]
MFSNRIGFSPRLGAALLDFVFIVALVVPTSLLGIGGAIAAAFGLENGMPSDDADALAMLGIGAGAIAMILVASFIALAYTFIEAFTGASPGKRVMGLQVAREDGSAGDTKLYFLRWALKNSGSILQFFLPGLSTLVSLVFFFGCFAALGEKKQALHDIIAKTAVFKKDEISG